MPDLTVSSTIDAFLAGSPDGGQQTTIKNSLALGSVDNTTDANKPVSTAAQTALDLKLDLAGGAMTGSLDMGGFDITNIQDINCNNNIVSYTMDAASGFVSNTGAAYFPWGIDVSYQNISSAYSVSSDYVDAYYGFTSAGYAAYCPYGVYYQPTNVINLPSYPVAGWTNYVDDASSPVVGSSVVGSGSDKCLVCYNGTDWIVTALL